MNNLEIKHERELKKRKMILNDNLWKVILSIALPLVLYNLCNYLYGIYDTMIVSKSNIGSVDSIAFLDQVKNMIAPLGASIAAGGCIIVARKYGSGKTDEAKKTANSVFFLCVALGLFVIGIFIPFGKSFLRLLNTPEEFISSSIGYFYVNMLTIAITFINNIFIGLEKAKGNTKRILIFNLVVVFIKITLTTCFVYLVPQATVTWVAAATLIAQGSMTVIGLFIMLSRSNIFRVTIKDLKCLKKEILPIVQISLPIFFGRFLFHYGKVFINTQALVYGSSVVGALAISNSISGSVNNIINSFEDAASTITSQNLGNNNIKRTFQTFRKMLVIGFGIGLIGSFILIIFGEPIARFFAPADLEKQEMIRKINFFENTTLCLLGVEAAANGLLYGYGKTRFTMLASIAKLFAFRIPVLLLLIHLCSPTFYVSTGIAMGISNGCGALLALTMALSVMMSIKKHKSFQGIEYNA